MIDLPPSACHTAEELSTDPEEATGERTASDLPFGLFALVWTRGLDLLVGTIGIVLGPP